ncbi:hypothetical protein KHA90_06365 [Flavobacterium psychroterrae]|uniref:Uncharacterized protein n=1 Tax=Flavobacterium psychroterrae TaxID=2133767 RepID=A0ABS5P909_9FLAO|nr:hypothetical protein [Flavobacterium psychroterrae]MBS7230641.1 hypothetical protein [Flavobacterium psychroterrae]
MYNLDQAQYLVEYYTIELKDKDITVQPPDEKPYSITNIVFQAYAGGTYTVHCVYREDYETIGIMDIEKVAKDCGLLSPSQLLTQLKN